MKFKKYNGWNVKNHASPGHGSNKKSELNDTGKIKCRVKALKELRKKELELMNTIGTNSISERHYPKSFTIKKEE